MSPRTIELLDLIARWVHVIAGIMWIGNSLLFNWLDRNLRPPSRGTEAGREGEIWLLHSGGFYFVEKTQLAGKPLPRPLHWFKWQAYTTWLSGAALLIVVYYVGGRALLTDPAVSTLSTGEATAAAAGSIVLGWLAYEAIWRGIGGRTARGAGAMSIAVLIAVVYALTHLLSGRAAFLHVGALLGTIMAANVATTIMPSQRSLVDGVAAGGGADAAIAERAKTRSIHNNYLTFPVIILMMSGHFPALHASGGSWLVLLLLIAAGAAVRHIMNVRFTWRPWITALAATVGVAAVALYALTVWQGQARGGTMAAAAGPVDFAAARSVIDRRCTVCHSRHPADDSFGPAPGGVAFDASATIRALAPRIMERAVVTRTMPPANATRMTEVERALLREWIERGAPAR